MNTITQHILRQQSGNAFDSIGYVTGTTLPSTMTDTLGCNSMNIPLPSFLDVSPSGGMDLDEIVALKHFLGKDSAGAIALFSENMDCYIMDLNHMGCKSFQFYFNVLLDYLLTIEDASFISNVWNLLFVLESKLQNGRSEDILPFREKILRCLMRYVKYYQTNEELGWDKYQIRLLRRVKKIEECLKLKK